MKAFFKRLILVSGFGLIVVFGCSTNSKIANVLTTLPRALSGIFAPVVSGPKQLYTLQPGDTPLGVALRFHTSVDKLVSLNAATHPEMGQTPMKFNAGWQIWVPLQNNVPASGGIAVSTNLPPAEGNTVGVVESSSAGSFDDAGAQVIIDLTNKARAEAGIPALAIDERLMAIAQKRAVEISTDWGHQGLADDCADCGENILKAAGSPQADFDLWMHSPSHKNNLLYSGYITIGVARYIVGHRVYCVQIFHE